MRENLCKVNVKSKDTIDAPIGLIYTSKAVIARFCAESCENRWVFILVVVSLNAGKIAHHCAVVPRCSGDSHMTIT